ncbi:hypothetical protein ACJJTC_001588 [Scirpophaga incertulas]
MLVYNKCGWQTQRPGKPAFHKGHLCGRLVCNSLACALKYLPFLFYNGRVKENNILSLLALLAEAAGPGGRAGTVQRRCHSAWNARAYLHDRYYGRNGNVAHISLEPNLSSGAFGFQYRIPLIQEGTTTVGTDEAPSTSFAVPKTKNKNLKRKFEDDLMQLASNRLTEKPDEYQNWGLFCAADLKKMDPMQQIFAEKAIADIIMEGQ